VSDEGAEIGYRDPVYEDRNVAFIDILGWRASIEAAGSQGARELGWLVQLLQQIEKGAGTHRSFAQGLAGVPAFDAMRATHVTQFSDSIVISLPADEAGSFQWVLEQVLAQICGIACQSGFLLRGGIARGPVFHRERMIYGPALIAAYDLEQRVRYPRILPSKSLDALPGGTWRRDRDGRLFFDYLRAFVALPGQYKHLICKGVLTAPACRVLRKYVWAAHYYDEALGPEYDGEHGLTVVHVGEDLRAFGKREWPRPIGGRPRRT